MTDNDVDNDNCNREKKTTIIMGKNYENKRLN